MRDLGQQDLPLRKRLTHGGARPGAGRPKKPDAGVPHEKRPRITRHHPAHVTLRVRESLPSLRGRGRHEIIERALAGVLGRTGFRVVHYSIQTNHLHLLVEAADAASMSRGMQALAIRIAKNLNAAARRSGQVFRDRYHARVLRTPTDMRHALCYVLQNFRRHATDDGRIVDPGWLDPRSSAALFDGWREGSPTARGAVACTSPGSTWLVTVGWRRRGLIRIDEVPRGVWRDRRRARGRGP
jgi:REP element-mobilizing transposase RayT